MSGVDKQFDSVVSSWDSIAPVLSVPKSEAEYDILVARMDDLLERLGADEDRPLNGLLHLMGDLVAEYDREHFAPVEAATGLEMLKHLMAEHELKQSDLPEVGSQGVVSEILQGRRELNRRHMVALGKRFGVPPTLFF